MTLLVIFNAIKCHEEVLSLQPTIPPKRFDISPPLTGGCSEGLDAFRFFCKVRVVELNPPLVLRARLLREKNPPWYKH